MRLLSLWLSDSECQMYCWGHIPEYWPVLLGLSLDSAKSPLAKHPLRLFWAVHPVRLGLSRRNSEKFRKDPGNALKAFPGSFPSRVRLGSPKPYNSRHLRLPEHESRIISPPVRLGAPLFSEVAPERASQSWSWTATVGLLQESKGLSQKNSEKSLKRGSGASRPRGRKNPRKSRK